MPNDQVAHLTADTELPWKLQQTHANGPSERSPMKSVAIGGRRLKDLSFVDSVETVAIEGIPVTVAGVSTIEPPFDPQAPANRSMVLIRVRAFSCNYRDKGLILALSQQGQGPSFGYIGSDFVGEVVLVGTAVTRFRPGDRVIPNHQYPDSGVKGVNPGIATNFASQRYQALHEVKLVKVPQQMPDEVAAAFSVGAQTTYSMLRKLELKAGGNILVTAAKSNTSLFSVNALRKYHVNVYATSTSMQFERELKALGVKGLMEVDPKAKSFLANERLRNLTSRIGGFDFVIDPLFDLHIGKVIDVMKPGGRYVTCGLYDQYSSITGKKFEYQGRDLSGIMTTALIQNIHLMGNCLGQRDDLTAAMDDFTSGAFGVVIDSVFSGEQVGAFFDRTYNARDRFGKVVYRYDDRVNRKSY
jgi:NADPH:quinone reductase-like Zn-dependent oxidoreductase